MAKKKAKKKASPAKSSGSNRVVTLKSGKILTGKAAQNYGKSSASSSSKTSSTPSTSNDVLTRALAVATQAFEAAKRVGANTPQGKQLLEGAQKLLQSAGGGSSIPENQRTPENPREQACLTT